MKRNLNGSYDKYVFNLIKITKKIILRPLYIFSSY